MSGWDQQGDIEDLHAQLKPPVGSVVWFRATTAPPARFRQRYRVTGHSCPAGPCPHPETALAVLVLRRNGEPRFDVAQCFDYRNLETVTDEGVDTDTGPVL